MPFSANKIISVYCIVDDLLKALGHQEDVRVRISDSEIITTAFVSVLYFGGHLDNARLFMKMQGYIPNMLDKSRFCRRLHRIGDLILSLFQCIGSKLKAMCGAATYVLDSFPVAACDNIRIANARILKKADGLWRGKHASMRRYFFGVRVQVLTLDGIPVEFCITPGRNVDNSALQRLPLDVAPESRIYADSGYTDYEFEDLMKEHCNVFMMVARRSNSKRVDDPHTQYLKEQMRKGIETTFSEIKARMLRHIHAVTPQGFFLKVALFVIAYTFELITP